VGGWKDRRWRPFIHLFISVYWFMSVSQSDSQPFVHLHTYSFTQLVSESSQSFVHSSAYPPTHPSIHPLTHLSIHPQTHPPIHSSAYPSIHPSTRSSIGPPQTINDPTPRTTGLLGDERGGAVPHDAQPGPRPHALPHRRRPRAHHGRGAWLGGGGGWVGCGGTSTRLAKDQGQTNTHTTPLFDRGVAVCARARVEAGVPAALPPPHAAGRHRGLAHRQDQHGAYSLLADAGGGGAGGGVWGVSGWVFVLCASMALSGWVGGWVLALCYGRRWGMRTLC
jgi:hypothetical protein